MDKWICTKCGKTEISQDTEYCEECSEKPFNKIGGWLYLPATGLILAVIFIIYQFKVAAEVASRVAYYSTLQNIVIFTMVANIILLLLVFHTAILFFNKLKQAPSFCILLCLSNVIIQGIMVFLVTNRLGYSISYDTLLPALQAIATAAIWIPYFMVSVRVKRTFVN
ncbi:hypothetical protein Xvie_03838 [Xenorhabdus vietnamensis]|uniref:DUF2569 domain-containing protein n=1 Tax=Xenorhabdus vietnamensis TaxID=351656 RepID=A0A1Y2S6R1_9GAMM|nr:DUF2569 domain-containing protein [Xenorhabdus vietnamensis]OTA14319.1 hypothetical protein Xvie_03838 [Xenorhabdus vietnamensis]